MRRIFLQDNTFEMDIRELTMAFFPGEQLTVKVVGEDIDSLLEKKVTGLLVYKKENRLFMELREKDKTERNRTYVLIRDCQADYETRKEGKDRQKRTLYGLYQEFTGKSLPWGTLTGIRPTKPVLAMLEEGLAEEEIRRRMRADYLCSEEKISLTIETAKKELSLLSRVDRNNGCSLYVGIPFCPTTCAYCSFPSYPVEQFSNRVGEYLNCLKKELAAISEKMGGKPLNSIYIGGGTPTTLSAEQLGDLIETIKKLFPMENCLEFTVEAGRPDSITREKLLMLKKHGVGRISINPQTMQEETLKRIGRKHTVSQVKEAFALARELGFENINMDFIVGLPGETIEEVTDTMKQVKALDPDSITVHSLAIKRAARLRTKAEEFAHLETENTWETIALTRDCAKEMGMEPYYLYRQKNMAGNFENVGYAKAGKEGLYNVLMMEELQTIVAAGAGASTKITYPDENRIERIENVKDLKSYIERIDEMIERKSALGQEVWNLDWQGGGLMAAVAHGMRVSRLAADIAKECGLSEEVCYEVALAGMVHDIGKLRLHSYFYGEEATRVDKIRDMQYMRLHANYSYDILKNRQGFSDYVLEAVLYHHENYDGTGYPEKLQGQDIPEGARILHISDVFVALTSKRPYRKAFNRDTALQIMIEEIKNFDMKFFLAFQRVLHARWEEEELDDSAG